MRKGRHKITSHCLNPKYLPEVAGTNPTYTRINNVFKIHNLLLATFRLRAVLHHIYLCPHILPNIDYILFPFCLYIRKHHFPLYTSFYCQGCICNNSLTFFPDAFIIVSLYCNVLSCHFCLQFEFFVIMPQL